MNQEKRQQSVRAVTGTAYHYEGDWHALFDLAGVASGTFNDRLRAWINTQLGTSYQFLPDAMQAYAVSQGFTSWNEMGTFSPYDASALAWFAAMPSQPSATVKAILNTFVSGLKSDGLWSKLDGGNVLALGTLGQCLVDFKVPSRVATTAASPTIDFIPYRGAAGSGAAFGSQTDYIDTGFIPSSAGGGYIQDSAQISVYAVDNITSGSADIGANGTAQFFYRTRSATDTTIGPCNNLTSNTRANGITDGSGFFTVSRTAAAVISCYRNGSFIAPNTTQASTGLPDVAIRYLQVQGLNGNTRRLAFGCYGQGLIAADVALLNTRVQTLVAALAAIDSYDTDAATWFAAMPTQPISRVKVILNDFVMGLKTDNLWSSIDGGNFLCLETLNQGLVDFKSPSRVATTAPGFTSTFTSYRGVTGSGSVAGSPDAYISNGFIPSGAENFKQDSAGITIHSATAGTGTNVDAGFRVTNDFYILLRSAADQFFARVNNLTGSGPTGITDGSGIFSVNRTGATQTDFYRNGVNVGSNAIASVGLPTGSFRFLQCTSLAASTRQITFGCFHAGLNATQAANLNTRVQTAISALTVL